MNIAKVVASRSNCMKRKVAAIIVRDKRVISTGYNGTPRGTQELQRRRLPALQQPGELGNERWTNASVRTAKRTRSCRLRITACR